MKFLQLSCVFLQVLTLTLKLFEDKYSHRKLEGVLWLSKGQSKNLSPETNERYLIVKKQFQFIGGWRVTENTEDRPLMTKNVYVQLSKTLRVGCSLKCWLTNMRAKTQPHYKDMNL